MDIQHYIHQLGQQAREASRIIAVMDGQRKNDALRQIAERDPLTGILGWRQLSENP